MNEKPYIKTIKECIEHLPNLTFREDAGKIELYTPERKFVKTIYNNEVDTISWFFYFLKKYKIPEKDLNEFNNFFSMSISTLCYKESFNPKYWNGYNLPENTKQDIFNTLKDNIKQINENVMTDNEGVCYNNIIFNPCKEINLNE